MSSDSEVEDILLRTPTLEKLRTLDRLSTDALDPDTLQAAAVVSSGAGGGQVRQSRPRDRQQRRAFSPLLDSTERDHYSVSSHSRATLFTSFSTFPLDFYAVSLLACYALILTCTYNVGHLQ